MGEKFEKPYKITAVIGKEHSELSVTAMDGWVMECDGVPVRDLTIRMHKTEVPRVGQRVMACGGHVLAEVSDVRIDQSGAVQVLDADTKAWMPWR